MNTTSATCKTCGGKGYLIRARQIGRGQFVREDETCPTCHGDGGPQPTPPAAALTVGGYTVDAPGFTVETFDRAVHRAHCDGLTIAPTERGDTVTVTNPTTGGSYTTSRRSCSCAAGQHGTPCKHRALAIMFADILHTLPARLPVAA